MDDKVYSQEIVPSNPFPGEVAQLSSATTPAVGVDNYTPTITKEKTFPKKRTAVELLSTSLNTRSRKILEQFVLQQSGGFQIGNFEEGITGDLRLTPNGITARDIAGITTFAIDGTTGDATFKGQIQSGSLITGSVIVGNNRVIIDVDENGQPAIMVNDGANDRILIGFQAGGF